jgi:hypothetical protein
VENSTQIVWPLHLKRLNVMTPDSIVLSFPYSEMRVKVSRAICPLSHSKSGRKVGKSFSPRRVHDRIRKPAQVSNDNDYKKVTKYTFQVSLGRSRHRLFQTSCS